MADWTLLQDAYGSAADIPSLIEGWTQQPSDDLMTDLWSRLCHQGTVYPASYHALPLLIDAAAQSSPKNRRDLLVLIGAIIASTDGKVVKTARAAMVDPLLPRLQLMIDASMSDGDVDAQEFIYMLQAALAFRDDRFWGQYLDNLAGDEFPGRCPACEEEFYLAIGQHGFFAVSGDYIREPERRRVPIKPAPPGNLPRIGAWLEQEALLHSQNDIAERILYLFGTTACPVCNTSLGVADAVERAMT